MNDEANFNFGKVRILEDCVISEINEGEIIDAKQAEEIFEFCESKFMGRPYGYISNRINSYSINPLIYLKLNHSCNVVAIAIITKNKNVVVNASIEKHFSIKPLQIFDQEQAAKEWINNILNSSN